MSAEQLATEFMSAEPHDRLCHTDVASVAGVGLPRVFAWIHRGVRGVKLASIGIGGAGKRCGNRIVLRSWLCQFLAETNSPGTAPDGVAA